MIEMMLRSCTDLDGTLKPRFLLDGSAHSFNKHHHPLSSLQITPHNIDKIRITTPIYPFQETKFPGILQQFETLIPSWRHDHKILIHAPDIKWCEINMLFQYHKISRGLQLGLGIFGGNVNKKNIVNWNADYLCWQDLRAWEYREWLSLFYPDWVQEWIQSCTQVTDDFLILTNQQILESTSVYLRKIIEFCGLKLLKSVDQFALDFQIKQRYVMQEYETIERISHNVINAADYAWASLSPVGEAILQHQFRKKNYEWRCEGLDTLPNNSVDFCKIVYKTTRDLHA